MVTGELEGTEPEKYKEAMASKERVQWHKAMEEEMQSLIKNQTWVLVPKPMNKKLVGCKWIYKKRKKEFKVLRSHSLKPN